MLRLRGPLTLAAIEEALRRVVALAGMRNPVGRLWIVDDHRIREFIDESDG